MHSSGSESISELLPPPPVQVGSNFRYESQDDPSSEKIYMSMVAELQNAERNTLFVQFPHISSYSRVLATAIELQFYRFVNFIRLTTALINRL